MHSVRSASSRTGLGATRGFATAVGPPMLVTQLKALRVRRPAYVSFRACRCASRISATWRDLPMAPREKRRVLAVCMCAEAERLVSSTLERSRRMLMIYVAALLRSLGMSSRSAATIAERMPDAASSIRYEMAAYTSSSRNFWWRASPHDGVWGKMWVLVCGPVPFQALWNR